MLMLPYTSGRHISVTDFIALADFYNGELTLDDYNQAKTDADFFEKDPESPNKVYEFENSILPHGRTREEIVETLSDRLLRCNECLLAYNTFKRLRGNNGAGDFIGAIEKTMTEQQQEPTYQPGQIPETASNI
jgi:hypothetical protein